MTQARKVAEMSAGETGYDRLAVPTPDGETRWMSRSAFEDMPLTDRVRLLAAGKLRFFRNDREISCWEAMRSRP